MDTTGSTQPNTSSMDTSNDRIEAKLPGRQRAYIRRIDATFSFDEPVYAVNWFNARWRWIYDFYNLIAARSVHKVGGAPLFKGRLTELVQGAEADRRDMILVVRYPGLIKFK